MSDSFLPHELQPAVFRCPWNFPGKNTGVGCHFLLPGLFLTQGSNLGLLHCRQTLYHLSHLSHLYRLSHLSCMRACVRVCVCVCVCMTESFCYNSRNYHNTVNQLYFKKNIFLKCLILSFLPRIIFISKIRLMFNILVSRDNLLKVRWKDT